MPLFERNSYIPFVIPSEGSETALVRAKVGVVAARTETVTEGAAAQAWKVKKGSGEAPTLAE